MTLLGDIIRSKRIEKEISLRQLSNDLNVSPIIISQIENHKKVPTSGETLKKLSQFLQKTFEEIQKIAEYTKQRINVITTNDLIQSEKEEVDTLRIQLARTLMQSKIDKAAIIEILKIIESGGKMN